MQQNCIKFCYFADMESNGIRQILKNHSLRVTDCRIDVLNKFFSTRELEDEFIQYDRVTMYRTLHSFVDKGILHSIPDDSGFARYGICHETCTPEEHAHNHIHFKCHECGNIECIPDHHAPDINLPGYKVKDVNMILNGVCEHCNSQE